MRPFARSVPFGAVAVVAACALPTRDEYASGVPVDGGSRAEGGASLADATASKMDAASGTVVPVDAGSDAAPPYVLPADNLLRPNTADFERGNCDDSGDYEAKLTGDGSAHSGGSSCRVCHINVADNLFSMDNGFDAQPTVGETYRATVWVKHAGAASLRVTVALRTQAGDSQIEQTESAPVTVGDDWQQLSVELTVTKPAKRMDTYTYGYADGGAKPDNCFLVDDYAVTRLMN